MQLYIITVFSPGLVIGPIIKLLIMHNKYVILRIIGKISMNDRYVEDQ